MSFLNDGMKSFTPEFELAFPAEEPADGEDRLTMSECHRGISLAKIMTTSILDARLGPYFLPECVKGAFWQVAVPVRSKKHP